MNTGRNFVLAGLVLALSSTPSYGEPPAGGGPGGPHEDGPRMERLVKELNLTKAQKEQFKKIMKDHKSGIQAKRDQVRAAHEKLRTAMQSDTAEAQLRKLHSEVIKLHGEMASTRFEKMLAIRKILTPDQRKKFKAHFGMGRGKWGKHGKMGKRGKHKQRGKERRGGRGGRGGKGGRGAGPEAPPAPPQPGN